MNRHALSAHCFEQTPLSGLLRVRDDMKGGSRGCKTALQQLLPRLRAEQSRGAAADDKAAEAAETADPPASFHVGMVNFSRCSCQPKDIRVLEVLPSVRLQPRKAAKARKPSNLWSNVQPAAIQVAHVEAGPRQQREQRHGALEEEVGAGAAETRMRGLAQDEDEVSSIRTSTLMPSPWKNNAVTIGGAALDDDKQPMLLQTHPRAEAAATAAPAERRGAGRAFAGEEAAPMAAWALLHATSYIWHLPLHIDMLCRPSVQFLKSDRHLAHRILRPAPGHPRRLRKGAEARAKAVSKTCCARACAAEGAGGPLPSSPKRS